MTNRLLIVSADDFGLTDGVCRGILSSGVSSVSVIALGPALERWASALSDSGFGVGLHVAFVGEDRPILSASELSTVVDQKGRLPIDWAHLLPRLLGGRIDVSELEREAYAQLERVRSLGLFPDHLDGHQHVQLWPTFGQLFTRVASTEQIPGVRTPDSVLRTPKGFAVRSLARRCRGAVRSAGLVTTDRFAGLDEAGALTPAAFDTTVDRLVVSDWLSAEINAHPGADPDPDRTRYRWGYRWTEELAALSSPGWRTRCETAGVQLGTYADLAALSAIGGPPG